MSANTNQGEANMTAQQTPRTFPMCTKCANGRDHLKQIAVITHWTRCTLCCCAANITVEIK